MTKIIGRGRVIIITAPSGAGKTTIVRHLLAKFDFLDFSVSATNRTSRSHEIDGIDYYFYNTDDFQNLISTDKLIEWEEVYEDQYYGTLKREIKRIWRKNRAIVFDVDVKGATTLKERFGDDALAIFIKPPSIEELLVRLKNRKTETPKSLAKRIKRAKKELAYENNFDKIIVNDVLETAIEDAEKMVIAFLEN